MRIEPRPDLRAAAKARELSGWRVVEAQHKNATIALVQGNAAEQAVLEDIIESVKPRLPIEAEGLHYLLSTPFRYLSPPPSGSRFRSRFDPAVFYGAEDVTTACAEAGYWRLRFWLDSAALAGKSTSMQMTLFEFHGATSMLLDLTATPFKAKRRIWTDPDNYTETQRLALEARAQGIEVIRSESARNGPKGRCLTLLTPAVFKAVKEPFRHQQQTWSLFLQPPNLTVWQRDLTGDRFNVTY
ncbi:MAG TPA: RES family NAD+ phosphorylase [Rhodocyclaceae bacterium]|nr:RES family NAD+ phosphorylase [Rhodocyclaceae bacterium]